MAFPEEIILPFPTERSKVKALRRVRSGLLCSSVKAIRERGIFDEYIGFVPSESRDPILTLTAAEWISPELAFVHYEAVDKLKLSVSSQVEIGMQVAQHLQKGFLSVAVRLARESGVTPWTVLSRYQQLWERYFDGSAVAVFKMGPKEARAEFEGFPLARIDYIKNGVNGILRGVTELVCQRIYVHTLPMSCGSTTLGYRLSWV